MPDRGSAPERRTRPDEVEHAYESAREAYARLGADTEEALRALETVHLSLHCWQGDDVAGFERPDSRLEGGGLVVTGAAPGRARNPGELRGDLEQALALIPGRHRVNLHAIYGEFGAGRTDRNEIEPRHFQGWMEWAAERNLPLDFNATCFSHPRAASGFTLSSRDRATRAFWIEHVQRCREIAAAMGRAQGTPCIHNLWIPDGSKEETPARHACRALLRESLDAIFARTFEPAALKDALESKLFGIGSESFVVGSHEFYLGYALTRGQMICLDLGHFHPTESVADKISSLLLFSKEILVHVSRGVRWDSDHVVVLSDDTRRLAEEIVRAGALERVHLALDYFDASLNRIGAWVIGSRAFLKAMLAALLEPRARLDELEKNGDSCGQLALLDELKGMPLGAVFDAFCRRTGVPAGLAWIDDVRTYEKRVLSRRESGKQRDS